MTPLRRSLGQYTSIAEAGGTLSISCHDVTNLDLKLAQSLDNGNTWATQTLDATGNVGQYTSTAATVSSVTHILVSYYDITNQDLKLKAIRFRGGRVAGGTRTA